MSESTLNSASFALALLLKFHEKNVDTNSLMHELSGKDTDIEIQDLVRVSQRLGMKARKVRVKRKKFNKSPFPFIAKSNEGYFIIADVNAEQGTVMVQFFGQQPCILKTEELWEQWDGEALWMTRRFDLSYTMKRFGISWFIPVIIKYRKVLGEVVLASFFLQLFALITPIGFQVVMDTVLVHQALSTLNVIAIALLVMSLFEIGLGTLRMYLFSHTSCRVDVELGSRLFEHLLKIPIAYFSARPVGQVVARIRELENIREFLTNNAMTLLLDLFFTIVLFIAMYFYSSTLTLLVLASIPFYILLSVLISPGLHNRAKERFERSAINQAFLTESITGMETLKSTAVEPRMQARWERYLAGYAKASFSSSVLGTVGSQLVQLINKVVTVALLWFGAKEVIAGDLTIGELIAFNMLSGQVAQPILRLSQLWQEFQQFRISIARLGDVLNTPREPQQSLDKPPMEELRGHIEMEHVNFSYSSELQNTLTDINLVIPAGQTVGIVGESGSGKSTLAKLLLRLYVPNTGKVLIDDNDIALLDPSWLRRQLSVVLQENTLFNGTVRENIAHSDPLLPMEAVIEAARLAGAHEFITHLARGYDTELGERGIGLSGGQRQRIAIARALISNPRILIFDEATSALDYESEYILQKNMGAISESRTVITIAHRLSTIRHCDRIIVMQNGRIKEDGTHHSLIQQNGYYAKLWNIQSGHQDA
ncbi:type I secretion system permease/ATPase [Endozoicomonas euniceicola]|uniref:Type I secretion system permease/ATPase n=1 Tax=Endozoicomonas euniceicola TaxID=1234143 RepID=A0ABY6GPF1_9GAMM|nr:type I secretion system permease/ATPase [Endozoicomonas euniceicola]UYM14607.1 type I secretion system permease/ATPase [Endozoicomonas euniceicola]